MRAQSLSLVLLVALTGCANQERAEVKQCEDFIKAQLRSPSTYKRIEMTTTNINPDNPSDLDNVTERWVSIEYDANNAFNAPIRDRKTCKFPLKNGVADTSKYIDFDAANREAVDSAITDADLMEANAVAE